MSQVGIGEHGGIDSKPGECLRLIVPAELYRTTTVVAEAQSHPHIKAKSSWLRGHGHGLLQRVDMDDGRRAKGRARARMGVAKAILKLVPRGSKGRGKAREGNSNISKVSLGFSSWRR